MWTTRNTRMAGMAGMLISAIFTGSASATDVTISRQLDADRYDPHLTSGQPAAEVLFMIGDTLVALDYDGRTIVPNLAESWTVSPDGLTYNFRIRPDAKFCDGKPIDAHAVEASYQRWFDPATNGLELTRAGAVDSVKAVSDLEFEYKLKQPYSELLLQMTQHPHTIVDAEQAKAAGADFGVQTFNGSGPYCLESWTPRDRTVLVPNRHYVSNLSFYEHKTPQVDRVIWLIQPEDEARTAALLSGQADITQYISYSSRQMLQSNRNINMSKADTSLLTRYYMFKVDRPNMSDVRVRRAINLLVDQDALTQAWSLGFDTPADTIISPATPDFFDGVDRSLYGQDVAEAERLLDEAGWAKGADGLRRKDGQTLQLTYWGFAGSRSQFFGEALQSDLKQVGVEMSIELFDATVAFQKLREQSWDITYLGRPYLSALDMLSMFKSDQVPSPNRYNWKDAETDRLLDTARSTPDPKVRAESLAGVQKTLHDAAVWVPLYHEETYVASSSRLRPIKAHGIFGTALYKGLDLVPAN